MAIDATAITSIDFSASRTLIELRQDLAEAGAVLVLVSRHEEMARKDLMRVMGTERVFDSRRGCLEAYRLEFSGTDNPLAGNAGDQ